MIINKDCHVAALLAMTVFVLFSFIFPTPVYAAACTAPSGGIDIGACFGFGNITSLGDATSRLVKPAFELSAAAVVIYFLLGAFKYLTSGGNKEEVEKARNMITHAIIGFILLMFAFLILQFLLSSLFRITGLQIF